METKKVNRKKLIVWSVGRVRLGENYVTERQRGGGKAPTGGGQKKQWHRLTVSTYTQEHEVTFAVQSHLLFFTLLGVWMRRPLGAERRQLQGLNPHTKRNGKERRKTRKKDRKGKKRKWEMVKWNRMLLLRRGAERRQLHGPGPHTHKDERKERKIEKKDQTKKINKWKLVRWRQMLPSSWEVGISFLYCFLIASLNYIIF